MDKMNNNTAYIIKRIYDIRKEKPGKKTLQKLIFLIEQKEIDLNYEYGLHFYGPYSGDLDAVTTLLSADGIIEFDYSGYSHKMSISKHYEILPENNLSPQEVDEIDVIISRFKEKSASDLELLTTAIYAYNNLEDKTKVSIINGVKKIKGNKYSEDDINCVFNDFDFFNKKFDN